MRVALDLQLNPPEVPKPLKPKWAPVLNLFYALCVCLLGYAGIASAQRFQLEAARTENAARLQGQNAELSRLQAEAASLTRQAAISGDLAEWLTITPPAQALTLLLTKEVQPNVSFSRLLIEMEQGQPNVRITVEMQTANPEAASRQVAGIQAALDRAGFRTINVDTDSPTPEGWRFIAMLALPLNGDFAQLISETSR